MEPPIKPTEVHPEDRDLVSRLAKLQEMHDQVHDLRTLLPQRLWNPVLATIKASAGSRPIHSPSALFQQLQKTADDGFQEVGAFKATWHSPEMEEVWAKTKMEQVTQGTDTWKVDYRILMTDLKLKEDGLTSAAERSAAVQEDPRDVVDRFKTKYPKLKLGLSDVDKLWPLTLKVAGIAFEIDRQAANDTGIYYAAAKPGQTMSNLQREIVKTVQQVQTRDSLSSLLDLLASYDGLMTRACDKCQKIIDTNLQFPVGRESNRIAGSEDAAEEQWLAYHRKCA